MNSLSKTLGGNLHALLTDVKHIKARIDKEIKQRKQHNWNQLHYREMKDAFLRWTNKLKILIKKYEFIFYGSLGTWVCKDCNIELQLDATPYYTIQCGSFFKDLKPQGAHTLHKSQKTLPIEVVKKVYCSAWAVPIFLIPKKDGSVWSTLDFHEHNFKSRIKSQNMPIFLWPVQIGISWLLDYLRWDPADIKENGGNHNYRPS